MHMDKYVRCTCAFFIFYNLAWDPDEGTNEACRQNPECQWANSSSQRSDQRHSKEILTGLDEPKQACRNLLNPHVCPSRQLLSQIHSLQSINLYDESRERITKLLIKCWQWETSKRRFSVTNVHVWFHTNKHNIDTNKYIYT